MNRKEFLSLLGMSATSFTGLSCLEGCTKTGDLSSGTSGPTNIDFSLDLSLAVNAALNKNGGYLYKNGIIVARTIDGQYVAVQQGCTHENSSIVYQGIYSR